MGSDNGEDETGSSRSERPEIITRDDSLVSENSGDIELHPEVIEIRQSSETKLRQREVVRGNRSRRKSTKHVGEAKTEGELLSETSGSGSFSSSSSRSLSIASSEDLFQVDTSKFIPKLSIPVSSKSNEVLEGNIRSSATSSSQDSYCIRELSFNQIISPTETPPIQVMDRSYGYDSSSPVIESNNTTPRGWSVASHDSLFSIHVGTASFSREQFLSEDQEKSGGSERYSGELCISGEPYTKSGEFFMFSPPTAVSVPTLEFDSTSVETARNSEASRVMDEPIIDDPVIDEPVIDASTGGAEDVQQQELNSPGTPSGSDGTSSSHPFANPVVKKKKSRFAFCCCCNCSWKFCRCSLPSFCTRPIKCHCPDCSWMFCCWNSTKKILCCSCCSSKGSKWSGHKCFPSFNCCRYWCCCRCCIR